MIFPTGAWFPPFLATVTSAIPLPHVLLCLPVSAEHSPLFLYLFSQPENMQYGRIALIISVLAPLFILFTLFGVRENRDDMKKEAPKVSFKKILKTIGGNDQLLWICLIFLLQQIGNGIVLGGVGANYIYFEFGYEGGLYGTFQTVGLAATALLMVFYPAIAKKFHRQKLVLYMGIIATFGYALQIIVGIALPAFMLKFWLLTLGFMLANLGQYNELKHGTRDEAIITSMRPFLTKLASSVTVIITTVSYIICRVTNYTNAISDIEREAEKDFLIPKRRFCRSTMLSHRLRMVRRSDFSWQ